MNKTSIGVTVLALGAGLAAGCGGGRAIFNVDAYSFFKGSVNDTVPYVVPPLTNNFSAWTTQKINLVPGLGSSIVNGVTVVVKADFRNQSGGPGSVAFQVYLASDSAHTYTQGGVKPDSVFSPPISASNLSGTTVQSVGPDSATLSLSTDSLFTRSAIWARIAATVSNPNPTVMQGKAVLTGLNLQVIVQDKLF